MAAGIRNSQSVDIPLYNHDREMQATRKDAILSMLIFLPCAYNYKLGDIGVAFPRDTCRIIFLVVLQVLVSLEGGRGKCDSTQGETRQE